MTALRAHVRRRQYSLGDGPGAALAARAIDDAVDEAARGVARRVAQYETLEGAILAEVRGTLRPVLRRFGATAIEVEADAVGVLLELVRHRFGAAL